MAKKPLNKKSEINVFKRIHDSFSTNINSHVIFIEEIGLHAVNYDQKIVTKLAKGLVKKTKKGKIGYHVSEKFLSEFLETVREKHPVQGRLFYRNTLISLITTFETLLAKIFRYYYTENPNKLSPDNKQISFFELKNLEKIKDAETFLISREVEKILRDEGLASKLEMLKSVFGINFEKIRSHVLDVEKAIKVRNLIIHNSAAADAEYVSKYGNGKIKKGDTIKVGKEYVSESLFSIYFFGSYILQYIQLHFSKDNPVETDFILNEALHYLISKKKYAFSGAIHQFIVDHPDKIKDLNKKMVIINYCISQKHQGKKADHLEKVLATQDWTVKSDDFEMCKAALLDDDEAFYKYFNKAVKNGEITKDEIDKWEIFSFYKEKNKFKTISKNIKARK